MAALDETESVLFRVRWPNFAEAGDAVREGRVADDDRRCGGGTGLALELPETCPGSRKWLLLSFDPFVAGLPRWFPSLSECFMGIRWPLSELDMVALFVVGIVVALV